MQVINLEAEERNFHNLQCKPRKEGSKIIFLSLASNVGESFQFKQTFEFIGL